MKLYLDARHKILYHVRSPCLKQNHHMRVKAMSSKFENKNILSEAEAAEYIGMSRCFLTQCRRDGQLRGKAKNPPYIKISNRARYLVSDLNAWLEENKVIPKDPFE